MRKRLLKKWGRQRRQAREDLQFEYLGHRRIPGTFMLAAYVADIPCPIGCIWYRFAGKREISIMWGHVHPWARRNGVLTSLCRDMRRAFPKHSIMTAESNRRSRPWLRKNGFEKKRRGWVLRAQTVAAEP